MNNLKKLILDIENFDSSKKKRDSVQKPFKLSPHNWIVRNLVGGIGTLFVRSILYEANINEHHVFRWRLENKYMQYLVLNYYIPGSMPKTISFTKLLNCANGIQKIRLLLGKGFFLKATLSERTGTTNTFDRTAEFEQIIRLSLNKHFTNQNEKWILQKRLNLKTEFRIHTFNNDVIYGMTFKIIGLITQDNCNAERFVKNILDKMPCTIVQESLIAWDIGLTDDDQYYVIESNFTGFHPEFNYGFQTSGYFQSSPSGPIMCAWFNMYMKNKYGISVSYVDRSLLIIGSFFNDFVFYLSVFRHEHFKAIRDKIKNIPLNAIIYLNQESNSLLNTLIAYFQRTKYAETYYIVTNEESFPRLVNLYKDHLDIKILVETTLFTTDQYQLIKQLSYERRSQISCRHVQRMLNKSNCVII
ncbi:hypothetical protein [Pedobacter sp. L105]|uniref:hypothetical protein n=1 Tax=Pedobacter sp. L105 TaxID=1641871 RepID=UPI00131E202E|nr:hypothetical protein [Pedobacter sp. L105]